jgi:SsrA-binding protein
MEIKEIQNNPSVNFEYIIIDTLEVGIELKSFEIKQIALKKCNIKGSFCKIIKGEVILFDMNIEQYKDAVFYDKIEPKRQRKILMHKKQIKRWKQEMDLNQHYSIVPQKIYINSEGRCKILMCLCKGKKLHDKRNSIKDRDISRKVKNDF